MAAENKIAELQEQGFCVLKQLFPATWIHACRKAFWPLLLDYLKHNSEKPNRGPHRHFMPMPFEPPCFRPELFFDESILSIVQGVMGEEIVADQWVCDTPVLGSENQNPHVDYQRPLFPENPDLALPTYMLVVSFGLVDIAPDNGPLEIAPGTHQMRKKKRQCRGAAGAIGMRPVLLGNRRCACSPSLDAALRHSKYNGDAASACYNSLCAEMVCGQQPGTFQSDPLERLAIPDVRTTGRPAIPYRKFPKRQI